MSGRKGSAIIYQKYLLASIGIFRNGEEVSLLLDRQDQTSSRIILEGSKNPLKQLFIPSDYYDYSLLVTIILLNCFGLIMLYSTSAYNAQMVYGDDMYYFIRQGRVCLACIAAVIIGSRLDYHLLKKVHWLLYVAAIGLMAMVRTPFGREVNGARRWLVFGPISFQPSEVAKLAVIITLACLAVWMKRRIVHYQSFAALMGVGIVQAGAAFLLTQNLSTGAIIFAIAMGMIFVAYPKTKVTLLTFAGLAVIALLFLLYLGSGGGGFRGDRITAWLNPGSDSLGDNYQNMQGLYAVGTGGLLGRGLGNSLQKLGNIPEAENDFIFSIICEELGILGAFLVVGLYAYLLYRLVIIAQNARDMLGTLLVSGVFIHLSLQVVLHISVNLGVVPNTGVTLPFISYGGTSILFLMAEITICLSVARQIRRGDAGTLL